MSSVLRQGGALLLAAILTGCGITSVNIKAGELAPWTSANSPTIANADGTRTFSARPMLSVGGTLTFPYDPLLWNIAHMPCIRTSAGDVMLLDTGLIGVPLAVTLDIVDKNHYPTQNFLSSDFKLSYVGILPIDEMNVTDSPAWLQSKTFAVHILGIPIYRVSGWVMGSSLLSQAKFVAFDNLHRQATFGFRDFAPDENLQWKTLEVEPHFGLPFVRVEVAGKPFVMLADSAGGPHMILNAAQWTAIEGSLKVLHHRRETFPTWGGFQEVDAYVVERLVIDGVALPHQTVWVRRGRNVEAFSLLGLNMFPEQTVVWDYGHHKCWIGTPRPAAGAGGAAAQPSPLR
jgi:hypothetical protein